MKFGSQLPYVQSIASERDPFVIKVHHLLLSKSDYYVTLKIHAKQGKLPGTKNAPPENVILGIGKPILGKCYTNNGIESDVRKE